MNEAVLKITKYWAQWTTTTPHHVFCESIQRESEHHVKQSHTYTQCIADLSIDLFESALAA